MTTTLSESSEPLLSFVVGQLSLLGGLKTVPMVVAPKDRYAQSVHHPA